MGWNMAPAAPTRRGMACNAICSSFQSAGQVIAERSGPVAAIDQPEVVIDAIRSIVSVARGEKPAVAFRAA